MQSEVSGVLSTPAEITVGALAAKYTFHAAIALLASIYFLDIFATLFLIPELRGKPLD